MSIRRRCLKRASFVAVKNVDNFVEEPEIGVNIFGG
jgi:hypothetical protein